MNCENLKCIVKFGNLNFYKKTKCIQITAEYYQNNSRAKWREKKMTESVRHMTLAQHGPVAYRPLRAAAAAALFFPLLPSAAAAAAPLGPRRPRAPGQKNARRPKAPGSDRWFLSLRSLPHLPLRRRRRCRLLRPFETSPSPRRRFDLQGRRNPS